MTHLKRLGCCLVVVALGWPAFGRAYAQTEVLKGNVSPAIASLNPARRAPANRLLDLKIVFALRNKAALDKLLEEQQNPSSPRYRRWLTPAEFAAYFGPTESELRAVTEWLKSEGFSIVSANIKRRDIRFTGTVLQAERSFGVAIVSSDDGRSFGNTTDPSFPRRFADKIVHIEGLDNLGRVVHLNRRPVARSGGWTRSGRRADPLRLAFEDGGLPLPRRPRPEPQYVIPGVGVAFGPGDFYTFYDETPVIDAGIDGRTVGCMALAEDSDFSDAAVSLFEAIFSVPAAIVSRSFPDLINPGPDGGLGEAEALLDIEWAHAVAPGAPLVAYIGNSNISSTPVVDAIQEAVLDNACGVISASFGFCGKPRSFFVSEDSFFAQAASQGQSVFVSSGDQGAAGLQSDPNAMTCVPGTSRNVNELSASPNVISVGGTMFTPNYDSSGNDIGFVPEQAWDEPEGATAGATGGGAQHNLRETSVPARGNSSGWRARRS